MRSKTILSISLLSFAALSSACSRNKVAPAPTPSSASADRAAIDGADRENAKLRADADRASADRVEAEKKMASDRSAITTPIFFQFDRSEINDEGIQILDQKVDALQRNAAVRIRVEGNADDSGSDEYNMRLSAERLKSVERALREGGVSQRIQAVAMGKRQPLRVVDSGSLTPDDINALNRRVEWRRR